MKKLVLSLSVLLLLALTLPLLVGCGNDKEGSGNTLTDFFGTERPEKCFGTECLVLPEYPDLAWLFGSDGESGYVSEEALAQSGKLKNGTSGYIVCLLFASSEQEMERVFFDLTYCSGTQILYDGEGVDVGQAEALGNLEVELDMTQSATERLRVMPGYADYANPHDIMQGAIIIPISFAQGSLGTLYVELSIEGEDMVNPQRETTETVQVGVDNATAGANIYDVSVGYLKQGDYRNGVYLDENIQKEPIFQNGEACYMVLDLSFQALDDNEGGGSINVLTYMQDRGAMAVTIEEAPTGKVQEVTQNNMTSIYASFSVPPEGGQSKVVRMLIRLLPISGGTVELEIYITGGAGTTLEGHTHLPLSLQTGEPALTYTLNEDKKGYTVTGLADAGLTAVNIPDVLGDGLPVTDIAQNLFRENTNIRQLIIGSGITELEAEAFYGCTALESVSIGAGMREMGDNVFLGCDAITSIYYNAANCTDESYGHQAFSGKAKAHVTIGKDVKYIPSYLFDRSNILSLSFEEGSTCTQIGKRAFSKCADMERVEIPCGRIGEQAFEDCTALREIRIGENVSYIGDSAFSGCTALQDIFYNATNASYINGVSEYGSYYHAKHFIFENAGKNTDGVCLTVGAAVTRLPDALFHGINYGNIPGPKLTSVVFEGESSCSVIGRYAFYGQGSLTYVQLPDSVTEIAQSAFAYSGLTMMVLSDHVTLVDERAFDSCGQLKSIVLGNGVTQIGKRAFSMCEALESVSLGKGVEYIGSEAFWFCENLQDVFYAGELAGWCGISFPDDQANPLYHGGKLYFGGVLLSGDVTLSTGVSALRRTFFGYSHITSVTLGAGVGYVGERAFYNCDGLTSVRIGADVTYLGKYALADCDSLQTVYYDGTVADWSNRVTKESSWCRNSRFLRVQCLDGTVNV